MSGGCRGLVRHMAVLRGRVAVEQWSPRELLHGQDQERHEVEPVYRGLALVLVQELQRTTGCSRGAQAPPTCARTVTATARS